MQQLYSSVISLFVLANAYSCTLVINLALCVTKRAARAHPLCCTLADTDSNGYIDFLTVILPRPCPYSFL